MYTYRCMLCTYIALGSVHISVQALHIYRSMLCTYIASCSVHISLYAQHILLFTYISACSVHSCSVHVALYVLLCTEPYVFIGIPSLGLRAVCLHKHSASEGALQRQIRALQCETGTLHRQPRVSESQTGCLL